jgi:ferrous iron transport protein A
MRPKTNQISLAALGKGESATILSLDNLRSVTNRLVSLGFTPGVEVYMTQNYGLGPLIVTLRGSNVALGRGEAAKIVVERRAV